jgi:hypothetical protein
MGMQGHACFTQAGCLLLCHVQPIYLCSAGTLTALWDAIPSVAVTLQHLSCAATAASAGSAASAACMIMSLIQVLPQLQPATPGKRGRHCNGMQVNGICSTCGLIWQWQQGNVSLEQPPHSLQWQYCLLTLLVQLQHLSCICIGLTQELQETTDKVDHAMQQHAQAAARPNMQVPNSSCQSSC